MLKMFEVTADSSDHATPQQLPVTARDIDKNDGQLDMTLPMADPCGRCGAFRMRVGDYVCFGYCWICFDRLSKRVEFLENRAYRE